MSRKEFDGGHQNQAHTSGFNLDFMTMHQLFHGGQSGAENVVRGLIDESQIAETGRTQDDVDDLGDLVDPQNDTYEEEGTHGQKGETIGRGLGTFLGKRVGLGKLGGAAGAKLGAKAEETIRDPEFQEDVKEKVGAAAESATEIAGKALGTVGKAAKGLIGKRGAGLASPSKGDASDSDDWGSTPDSDDPFA